MLDDSLSRAGFPRGMQLHTTIAGYLAAVPMPKYVGDSLRMCKSEYANSRLVEACGRAMKHTFNSDQNSWIKTFSHFGLLYASGLSEKEVMEKRREYESDKPVKNSDMIEQYQQLGKRAAGKFGIKIDDLETHAGAFGVYKNFDIPIKDSVWLEFKQKYKETGLENAHYWLINSVLDDDFLHFDYSK